MCQTSPFFTTMPRTQQTPPLDDQIEYLLNEYEVEDFIPSNEDFHDPKFQPATIRSSEYCESDDSLDFTSDTEGDTQDAEFVSCGRGRGEGKRRFARTSMTRLRRGHGMRRGGRARGQGINQDRYSPSASATVSAGNWTVKDFEPKFPEMVQPTYLMTHTEGFTKIDYLKQYINDELIDIIVTCTNQNAIEKNGRSLYLTVDELYVYLGITFVMAAVNYPNLRMYWEKKWRVQFIADNMSRDRFILLTNSLKVVFDPDITPEMKAKDKLWKMRPLIDRILAGCQRQEKEQCLSLDEMIIPFTGPCTIKQYCPGKPNPVGLKAFVLANPDGTICDFHIYQGDTTYASYENFGLGEKAVLTLSENLVPGHILYFDTYFTSEKLLDELEKRGIKATGTVMKNRIPGDVRPLLIDDKEFKKQGRGSCQVVVRKDGQVVFTKWFDNKPVLFLSSVEAKDDVDICRRWCKKTKEYVNVPRPRVVRQYNQIMGGVDLADRLMAVCPHRYRTRKWTQRFFSAMIGLAIINSWLQYKKDQLKSQVPIKEIQQLRAFKLELGETLIESYAATATNSSTDIDESNEKLSPIQRKRGRRAFVPVPSKKFRTAGAKHLPYITDAVGRCRHCHSNRTLFKCSACKINLCLTKIRNCFGNFHNGDE